MINFKPIYSDSFISGENYRYLRYCDRYLSLLSSNNSRFKLICYDQNQAILIRKTEENLPGSRSFLKTVGKILVFLSYFSLVLPTLAGLGSWYYRQKNRFMEQEDLKKIIQLQSIIRIELAQRELGKMKLAQQADQANLAKIIKCQSIVRKRLTQQAYQRPRAGALAIQTVCRRIPVERAYQMRPAVPPLQPPVVRTLVASTSKLSFSSSVSSWTAPKNEKLLKDLVNSIHGKNVKNVKELLQEIPVSDLNNCHSVCPTLITAATIGCLEIVKLLVEAGALNSFDEYNALYAAAKNAHPTVVHYLLDQGADPEIKFKDSGYSREIFSEAIKPGNFESVELLVAYAKNKKTFVTAKGNAGETPVQIAFQEDCADILALFLAHGADLKIYGENTDENALFLEAAECGLINMVRFFYRRGISLNCKGEKGATALHLAAANNHQTVVGFLLVNEADRSLQITEDITYTRENKDKVIIKKGSDYKKHALLKLNAVAADCLKGLFHYGYNKHRCMGFKSRKECLKYLKNPKDMDALLMKAVEEMEHEEYHTFIGSLVLKGANPLAENNEGKSILRVAREKLKEMQKNEWWEYYDEEKKQGYLTLVDQLHKPYLNLFKLIELLPVGIQETIREFL